MSAHDATATTTARGQPSAVASPSRQSSGGPAGTLLLALVATAGRVVVPVTVQQTVDRGLLAGWWAGPGVIRLTIVLLAALVIASTAAFAYAMKVRLYAPPRSALATLPHPGVPPLHDLSILTQNAERRGSMARGSPATRPITQFLQWGGVILVVSLGQIMVTTVLMALYSWQLTLIVWACFLPLSLLLRFQRRVTTAYGASSASAWARCSAPSPNQWSARPSSARTGSRPHAERIDAAVDATPQAPTGAQRVVA